MSRWKLQVSHFKTILEEEFRISTVFIFVFEGVKKAEPQSYITVTIDTKHKVTDHYIQHEKLGV